MTPALTDRGFRDRLIKGTVRVTLEHEAPNVNAYLVALDKGGGKVLVASILKSAADADDTLLEDFRLSLDCWLERLRDRAKREA